MDNPYESPSTISPHSRPRFRWWLPPAILVGFLGLLATAGGLYGVTRNVWMILNGKGTAGAVEFILLTILGLALLFAARAFFQSKWLRACLTTAAAILMWQILQLLVVP